jgi:hypothetical protein
MTRPLRCTGTNHTYITDRPNPGQALSNAGEMGTPESPFDGRYRSLRAPGVFHAMPYPIWVLAGQRLGRLRPQAALNTLCGIMTGGWERAMTMRFVLATAVGLMMSVTAQAQAYPDRTASSPERRPAPAAI